MKNDQLITQYIIVGNYGTQNVVRGKFTVPFPHMVRTNKLDYCLGCFLLTIIYIVLVVLITQYL